MLKKILVLGGGGLLVLALLGGGGFYGWKKWQASKAAKEGAADAKKAEPKAPLGLSDEEYDALPAAGGGEGEGAAGPAVLVYKNNVNLEGKKNAYLVVEFDVLFRDPELGKLATSEKPTPENSIIRARILEALSGKTLEEASDLEMRESIRQDIKDKLNEEFAPKPPKAGEKEDPKKKRPLHPIKDVLVVSWAIAQ